MTRFLTAAFLACLFSALAVAGSARADSNFHTERIDLLPVGDAALRSGFVVDIHANGPKVFAHERYVLVGASPDSTYQMRLQVFADTGCQTNILTVPTASLHTNAAGNASGDFFFRPADAPHNVTVGIIWQVTRDGSVVYQTGCIAVTTD
ncbi:MAG: hypothetical protein M3P30_16365 [Chloroflexota bacterium]|nr:hypothetical protein [Chloroflexota bacterium]